MTTLQSVLRALVFCAAATVLAFGQSTHYSFKVNTVAGSYRLGDGGPATSAVIEPYGVAAGQGGVFYIGDKSGRVRKVAGETITTLVDLGTTVMGVATDQAGNVYAATADALVHRISPLGEATIIAGGGMSLSDGIHATSALLFAVSIAVDANGRILVADYLTNRIRAIEKDGSITTIAGTGEANSTGDGGQAVRAGVDSPTGIALDTSGNLYIAEYTHIRKVSADGVIKTIAGDGYWDSWGEDVLATTASVVPDNVAVDAAGNIYFCESGFDVVRKIGVDGIVKLAAGNYDTGFAGDNSVASAAILDTPVSLVADSSGNILVADFGNARIRRITAGGSISTVAGSGHFAGDGGQASDALFWEPHESAYDDAGNLYIADFLNRRIRQVSSAGTIRTLAGNGLYSPKLDNVPSVDTAVGNVTALALDPQGHLVYGGYGAVRKIDRETATVTTLAGNPTLFGNSGDGGPASAAKFYTVDGLAWDKDGNLYLSDSGSHRVRKISTDGMIAGFAGTGRGSQSGDGGPAISANIAAPTSLAFDSTGNLYILSDSTQIRKIAPDGTISTVIEQGLGSPLDETPRPVNKVTIDFIDSLAVDKFDTLFFTVPGGIAATKDGLVWRVAGRDEAGFTGDGGTALNAQFGTRLSVSAGPGRTLVVSDSQFQRVRVLSPLDPKLAEITGGNRQTGVAGAALQTALSVRVSGAGGLPAAVVPVTFAVTSGAGSLGTASAMTDATGTAQTTLTPGDAGTIKVSATVAGLPPLEFTATATAAQNPGTPTIADGGITGAALSVPPVRSVSPNAIVTVWGNSFIAAGTQRRLSGEDLVNGRVPTKLGGICVDFDGQRAPIFDVYPSQLNIQVPAVSGASVSVRVIRNCGEAAESASAPAQVNVASQAPEFFAFSSRADGHVPVAARHYPSNAIVGPAGAYGEPSEPAKPGSIVTIYGTGFGLTAPDAFAPGQLPDKAASPVGTPVVTLGGVTLAPADVLYAGVTPGFAGLYQLNIHIPDSVPDGEQPLILKLGNASTPSGPYLLIRRTGGSNAQ